MNKKIESVTDFIISRDLIVTVDIEKPEKGDPNILELLPDIIRIGENYQPGNGELRTEEIAQLSAQLRRVYEAHLPQKEG